VLPNLIIIGGQKCGTTSLHMYLAAHPEISMSTEKELNFFTSWGLRAGLDWYESQFGAAPVRGESSPAYTAWPHHPDVPEAIHRALPDVKLIYLVRDPVDRILSEYLHKAGHGLESRPLEAVVQDDDFEESPYVAKSRYAMQLERYLRLFERSQLLVLTQEELLGDRRGTVRTVFRFLGVDDSFVSPRFLRRYNQARDWRGAEAAERRARALLGDERYERLAADLPRIVTRVSRRALLRPIARPELSAELHDRLVALLADDTARLADITGLDLSHWSTASPARQSGRDLVRT
jgi:hypothetical protein